MHITSLRIRRLRAIRELLLDLETETKEPRRRVVLLGVNGAGKTTILDAIAHVFQSLGPETLGATRVEPGDVNATSFDTVAHAPGTRPQANIDLNVSLVDEEKDTLRPYFQSVSDRGLVTTSVPPTAITKIRNEASTFSQVLRVLFRDTQVAPAVLLPADRGGLEQCNVYIEDAMRFDPREGCLAGGRDRFAPLAARLALAGAAPRFDPSGVVARMWKVLGKYFPELPRPVDHGLDLNLWFVTANGSVVPLSKLSAGERATLLIFGELALRRPQHGVVLIDEIEQHLHPRWQRTILEALRSLLPSAQFIITTQSPYVAAVTPDDVIKIGDWDAHGE